MQVLLWRRDQEVVKLKHMGFLLIIFQGNYDLENVCTTMRCTDPASGNCDQSDTAGDGAHCGNHKVKTSNYFN